MVAGLGEWDKFILKKYGMGIAAIVRINVKTYFLTYLPVNFVGFFVCLNIIQKLYLLLRRIFSIMQR